jgi:hypothetical protein
MIASAPRALAEYGARSELAPRRARAGFAAAGLRAACALVLLLVACSEVTTSLAKDKDALKRDDASALGAPHDASVDATALASDAATQSAVQCGDHVCACSDGRDNDGDALSDGFDPECTGPFDDDEASFATGAPVSGGRCRDCFWDNNAGPGDDDCRYPAECLQSQLATGKGACASCQVSQFCVNHCGMRTPNGCDCFGCCQVTRGDGSTKLVALNDACSLAKLDDEQACPQCVQSPSCLNPCGHCELCPGRTPKDLPADCGASGTEPGRRYVCDEGQPVCSATTGCPPGAYCQLGCCLYVVE